MKNQHKNQLTITPAADAVRPLKPRLPDEFDRIYELERERDTLQAIASGACFRIAGLELRIEALIAQIDGRPR